MLGLDTELFKKGLLAEQMSIELGGHIIELAWSPDGSKLATITVEGDVYLIHNHFHSVESKKIGYHQGGANSLSWRSDGTEFATAGHDGLVKIWRGNCGQQLASLEAGKAWVNKVAYHPFNNVLATAAGKHLKLWNESRAVIYESLDHASTIEDLVWHPTTGSSIAAAAYNGITTHSPEHNYQRRTYSWKGSSLVLAWSPDAKYLASGEQDLTVHFWHIESGEHAQMWGFPTKVKELSWDASGRWLATGGGHSICLWDCSGDGPVNRAPRQYEAHTSKLTQVAFQPDGPFLASSDAEGFLFMWEPLKYKWVIGGLMLSSKASCLRWHKGNQLAVGQDNGKVIIFKWILKAS